VRSATSCYNPEVALTAEPGRLSVPQTASSIDKTSAGKRQRGGAVRPTVLQPQPASNRHKPFTSNRFCFNAKSSFQGQILPKTILQSGPKKNRAAQYREHES